MSTKLLPNDYSRCTNKDCPKSHECERFQQYRLDKLDESGRSFSYFSGSPDDCTSFLHWRGKSDFADAVHFVTILRETKGTKAKEELLKSYLESGKGRTALREMLRWAFDWTRTIGVTASVLPWGDAEIASLCSAIVDLQERKITGDAARLVIHRGLNWVCDTLDEKQVLIDFLNKEPRLGIAEKSISKIAPGLIPPWNGCMLAKPWDGSPLKFPLIADRKIDGMRCLIVCKDGEAKAYSREGKPLPGVQFLCDRIRDSLKNYWDNCAIGETASLVFDGELFANDWNTTLKLVKTESEIDRSELVFWCFDIVSFPEWERGSAFSLFENMASIFEHSIGGFGTVTRRMVYNMEEMQEFYDECLRDGFEGIMLKKPNYRYECKRSSSWLKYKPVDTIDYPIIGTFEGRVSSRAR